MFEQKDFIDRLVSLRMQKDVSAREMSLSLGQGESYINNIETGVNFPSMQTFFYICEYLNISPKQFFDVDTKSPTNVDRLTEAAKDLSEGQLEHLIAIVKDLQRR